MEELCMVYMTASGYEEARKIADELISMKLAACANIIGDVESIYWWQGEKETSVEAAVLLKTKKSLFPEIEETIKKLHSYSCPCILAYPVAASSKDYAEWIESQTK